MIYGIFLNQGIIGIMESLGIQPRYLASGIRH